jgi:hypothetical protein
MKGSRSQNNLQNKQMMSHKPRPEIRDNLDSRDGEEQNNKGDDTTHNVKEKKSGHLKNKGKDKTR